MMLHPPIDPGIDDVDYFLERPERNKRQAQHCHTLRLQRHNSLQQRIVSSIPPVQLFRRMLPVHTHLTRQRRQFVVHQVVMTLQRRLESEVSFRPATIRARECRSSLDPRSINPDRAVSRIRQCALNIFPDRRRTMLHQERRALRSVSDPIKDIGQQKTHIAFFQLLLCAIVPDDRWFKAPLDLATRVNVQTRQLQRPHSQSVDPRKINF